MATENEKKFLLKMECSESEISSLSKEKWHIFQGYLVAVKGVSLRCRKQTSKFKTYYTLTFKSTVVGGRVVEIEKRMDERDFNDLWPQCLNKVEKIRYVAYDGGNPWEIDFFKDHNNKTYFVMAEFEMPEGRTNPDNIPFFIKNSLLYEVALTDCRFASKFLSDVRYALNLYSGVKR